MFTHPQKMTPLSTYRIRMVLVNPAPFLHPVMTTTGSPLLMNPSARPKSIPCCTRLSTSMIQSSIRSTEDVNTLWLVTATLARQGLSMSQEETPTLIPDGDNPSPEMTLPCRLFQPCHGYDGASWSILRYKECSAPCCSDYDDCCCQTIV